MTLDFHHHPLLPFLLVIDARKDPSYGKVVFEHFQTLQEAEDAGADYTKSGRPAQVYELTASFSVTQVVRVDEKKAREEKVAELEASKIEPAP